MSMLPGPVTTKLSRQRRVFRQSLPPTHRRTLDILLTRSRLTNLGVAILSAFAVLSFLYNLSFYFGSTYQWKHDCFSLGPNIRSTISRPKQIRDLSHLIVVPGHSIWLGSDPSHKLDENDWLLESYQKGGGRVSAFVSHITRGAELALKDERSLLVFSGGQTRPGSTMTEADSYLRLALSSDLFHSASSIPGSRPSTFPRVTTENHALDSYQNLLFSIARFHEYTGRWPEQITVVGYEMKRPRFTELHREALRWPLEKFTYIGVDAKTEGNAAQQGELQNGFLPYSKDTYGCHSTLLAKRRSRNPFLRFHSYYTSSPELAPLLDYCPEKDWTELFDGPLPWDSL